MPSDLYMCVLCVCTHLSFYYQERLVSKAIYFSYRYKKYEKGIYLKKHTFPHPQSKRAVIFISSTEIFGWTLF